MSHNASGRHRSTGRFNPLSEIAGLVAESASPAVKTTAVLAASGGLVAAFALPAQADEAKDATAARTAVSAPARPAAEPAAAPAAPAVSAPKAAAKASPMAFGLTGFTATAKPKPKPKPVVTPEPEQAQEQESASETETPPQDSASESETPREERAASRSTRRTSPSSSATATQSSSSESSASSSSSEASGTGSSSASSSAQTPKPTSTPESKPASGGVLSIAASLSGIYYVYGGTTTAGFDCSGFTSYVFRQVGVSLPRTAEQQRQAVTPVSNPQPGDLVFFGSPAYHVGIYAGNGMMYDSPRSGKTTGLHKIWSSNVTYGRP
ncbi:MAG: C40 family peptidase [Micrococcales bacterium]|nr:C40 family peptidase [Micrococcales bacterium]